MAEQKVSEWQCPSRDKPEYQRKGWIDDLVASGDRFVKGQQGIKYINDDIRLLMGTDQRDAVKSNNIWADYRTFVETISDLSQIATMGTKAEQFKQYATTYNGVFKHIFWDSQFLWNTRRTLQWAMLGRGYMWQKYSRDRAGWGKGKIRFVPLGPFDVLPEQLPMDNDVQGSYAATIIVPMPIWEAHARFPKFQAQLQPISRYDWKTYGTAMTDSRLTFYDRWRFGQQPNDWLNRYALGISEPIPTPTGWVKMGELKSGDYVYGGDGSLCKVTIAHPIQSLESYRITFSDNSSIIASGDHQWYTSRRKSKRSSSVETKLRTTKEIFETRDYIHRIDVTALDMPEAWLPIDPYLLGLWLGDGYKLNGELTGIPQDLREIEKVLHSRGHKTVSFAERESRSAFGDGPSKKGKIAQLRIDGFERSLRTYGILGRKRIPIQYLRASFQQRLDLLRGLMDTDGWVTVRKGTGEPGTQCGWGQTSVHKELTEDVSELLNSLGIKNTWGVSISKKWGRDHIWHNTQLSPTVNVFNLPRKRDKQIIPTSSRVKSRYIVDVEAIGERLVRCITVNSGDHTFLAGKSMIRTHNCEMRYTFVEDLSINTSGRTLQMGTPDSSWGYVVPSVGDLLVSINPFTGLPESRKATEEDCRIYPQKRMIITSPTVPVPMYDDTAFDWHGEIPIAEYDVNDVPWSPYGHSVIHGVASLERARRSLLSLNDQTVKINTDPPLGWDMMSGVKPDQLTKLKLLESQGVRIGTKGNPGLALGSILPEGQRTTEQNWKDLDVLEAEIKKNLGLTDIVSLRDLKMNISGDNFEKILQNLGPIAKGIALTIGRANSKHANMLKFNIAQYISVNELIDMVGPSGVAIETYDNDPNSLVPGSLPGELLGTGEDSRFHKRERAEWFVEKLNVVSTPEQLLNITQLQERMTYMFLFQKDAKLPTATYMEKFGVKGYEAELQQWREEKVDEAQWELEVQAAMAQKMDQLGIQPPQEGPGQGKGGGRPGTSQVPPHPVMKGSESGNVRVVNSQS